jgi:hypothetical protein
MDVIVAESGIAEVDRLRPLWHSMVEHHRRLTGHEWPVRDAEAAWDIRRSEYLDWLGAGSATLFTAAEDPSAELVGYAMLRITPPGATWDLGPEIGEVESLAVLLRARGEGSAAPCSRRVATRSDGGASTTGWWPWWRRMQPRRGCTSGRGSGPTTGRCSAASIRATDWNRHPPQLLRDRRVPEATSTYDGGERPCAESGAGSSGSR